MQGSDGGDAERDLRLRLEGAFALKGVDGKTYELNDVRGPKGTLVVFICNHCPYVRAIIDRLTEVAYALQAMGFGVIAIMPNDTRNLAGRFLREYESLRARAQIHLPIRHR